MPMTALFGPGSMPKNNRGLDKEAVQKSFEEIVHDAKLRKEHDMIIINLVNEIYAALAAREKALGNNVPFSVEIPPLFFDSPGGGRIGDRPLQIHEAIVHCLRLYGPLKYGDLVDRCLQLPNFDTHSKNPKNSIQTICIRMRKRGQLVYDKKTHLYRLPDKDGK